MEDDDGEGVRSAEQRKLEECPYEILRNCKSSAENIVAEMLSIKKEGKPKSQISELVTQMFLNFVTLRQVPICTSPYLLSSLGFITKFVA